MRPDNHAGHKEKEIEVLAGTVLQNIRKSQIRDFTELTANSQQPKLSNFNQHLPSKNSSLQFPRMSLHLIPMLIHTPKKVRASMHIQHNSPPRILQHLPLIIIRPHLNPLRFDFTPRSPPLPPNFAPHLLNSMMTQLLLYVFCGLLDVLF